MNEQEILDILQSLGDDIVKDMRSLLQLNGNVATGRLLKQLNVEAYKDNSGKYSLSLTYPFYGKFIDEGRNPTKATAPSNPTLYEEIKKWVKVKGIPEEAAWPITKKIHEEGYKARPFLYLFYNDVKVIADIMGEEFAKYIVKTLIK